MDLAKVGCHIQSTKRFGASDEIRVPPHLVAIGAAVEALPEARRAAVVCYYVRGWGKRPRRSPELKLAEDAVGIILYGRGF